MLLVCWFPLRLWFGFILIDFWFFGGWVGSFVVWVGVGIWLGVCSFVFLHGCFAAFRCRCLGLFAWLVGFWGWWVFWWVSMVVQVIVYG